MRVVGERIVMIIHVIFFFQAKDDIRDIGVTGVQTCALPIFGDDVYVVWLDRAEDGTANILFRASADGGATFGSTINISSNANEESFPKVAAYEGNVHIAWRSEERRVGKECRSRRSSYHSKLI